VGRTNLQKGHPHPGWVRRLCGGVRSRALVRHAVGVIFVLFPRGEVKGLGSLRGPACHLGGGELETLLPEPCHNGTLKILAKRQGEPVLPVASARIPSASCAGRFRHTRSPHR
jgi:hypothetical protein